MASKIFFYRLYKSSLGQDKYNKFILFGKNIKLKKIYFYLCSMKFVTNHFKLCPFMLLPSLLAFYAVLWCNKDSFRQDFSSSGKKKALSLEAKSSVFKIYILHNAFVLNLNILKNFSSLLLSDSEDHFFSWLELLIMQQWL